MALQQGLITITGRVGSNPQGHGSSSPPTICTFRLGSTRGYYDANRQWRSLPTTWITVKAYRTLSANVHASVRTGDPIIAVGVLATEEWSSANGEKRSRIVIEASNVGHDLNYGMTRPSTDKRDNGGTGGVQSAGGNAGQGMVGNGVGAGGGTDGAGPEPVRLLADDPYQGANARANMPANGTDSVIVEATGGGIAAGIGTAADGRTVAGGNDGSAMQAAPADSPGGACDDPARGEVIGQCADASAHPTQGTAGGVDEIPPPSEPPGDEFGQDGEF